MVLKIKAYTFHLRSRKYPKQNATELHFGVFAWPHVESAGALFRLQALAKAAAKTDLTYMLKISASL